MGKLEENVALDSAKQKKFAKNVKGIQNLIKTGTIEKVNENKSVSSIIKEKKKRVQKTKGLVYLSHIPHGFYEHQMTEYFKQFGVVTNARVIRSKRTGKSKGYAFVEFADESVGQVVADTMNNYLMGKRLLKAAYIPPEKQRPAFRMKWNAMKNPGSDHRLQIKQKFNRNKTNEEDLQDAKKMLKRIAKNKKALSELDIDYSFFQPVDVPTLLMDLVTPVVLQKKKDKGLIKKDKGVIKKDKGVIKKDKEVIKKDKRVIKHDKGNSREKK